MIYVCHTTPCVEQPVKTLKCIPERPAPVPKDEGNDYLVEKILKHRKRGRGYQFHTKLKGAPHHNVMWQTTRDFRGKDGIVTEALHTYIVDN